MSEQSPAVRPPAVVLDTVIWRRLAAHPSYLAKIRQLVGLARADRIHLAVPEIIKEEFSRRIAEIETAWPNAVASISEGPLILREHFPDERADIADLKRRVDSYVHRLQKQGSTNLALIREIIDTGTCCKLTETSLAKAARRSLDARVPAKQKTSIGDALIWHCVVSHLEVTDVFFCTKNTSDFCDRNAPDKLHPDLLREVADAKHSLKYFDNVDAIIESFEPLEQPTIRFQPYDSPIDGPDRDRPTECPKCGAVNSFAPGTWGRSQYGGGLSWQYICKNCGLRFDTGDAYD